MAGIRIGLGEQQPGVAGVGEGDPLLGAVEPVCLAVAPRRRAAPGSAWRPPGPSRRPVR